MKIKSKIFVIVLFCSNSFGQNASYSDSMVNSSGAQRVRFADSLSQVREFAKSDIANQKMFLLLSSGISPIVYSTDLRFENDFKIKYLESGCTGPKEEFAIEYNNTIFNYLTDKYGTKWKKDVRKDVSGLKNYKFRKNK